jgi:transcription elongation factor GreA
LEKNKKVSFTPEGHERVTAELQELIDVKRPEIIAAVAEARSHGDLRENAAYDVARQDQAMLEKRIAEMEEMLRNAEIMDDNGTDKNIVGIGRTVTVEFDGDEEVYRIVGPAEAQPMKNEISEESPIGSQLTGRRVGDSFTVDTPGGEAEITIKRIS